MTPTRRRFIRYAPPFTVADLLAALALIAFGAVVFVGLPLIVGGP